MARAVSLADLGCAFVAAACAVHARGFGFECINQTAKSSGSGSGSSSRSGGGLRKAEEVAAAVQRRQRQCGGDVVAPSAPRSHCAVPPPA